MGGCVGIKLGFNVVHKMVRGEMGDGGFGNGEFDEGVSGWEG